LKYPATRIVLIRSLFGYGLFFSLPLITSIRHTNPATLAQSATPTAQHQPAGSNPTHNQPLARLSYNYTNNRPGVKGLTASRRL
jgi:hypothetical protein